jgi:3-hydroxyisobutyrate dehydrogenase-like beta-hydroxyacid dehydrogenase
MSASSLQTIGIIGLGKMGLPMARHLIAKGFAVVGSDPSDASRSEASAAGVHVVETPADVRRQSDGVLVIVGFDAQATAVCLGPDGISSADSGATDVLMCSTIHPDTSVMIRAALAEAGVGYADATMCRAEHAAVDGTLLMLFGGDQQLLERWNAPLSAFATDIVRVGDVGSGQVAKMINNVLLWITVLANQEALRFASSLGVEQEGLVEALLLSSGANWALETWKKSRPMPWAEDDLSICLSIAGDAQFPLPLTASVRELMKTVKADKARLVPGGASASMFDFVGVMDALHRADQDGASDE